jgi:predicted enzyme related to lactoylglutathione lyase
MSALADVLINVDVDDLARAERFYVEAFGLVLGRKLGPDVRELEGGPVRIYLLQKQAGTTSHPGATTGRDYARHWTPVHLDFVVNDVEAARRRVLGCGATAEGEIRDAAYGRIAYLSDPFGNGFCLLEFRGRGYDALT